MKTALITGATSGIGKITAREIAQQGYKTILHGRNEEKAKKCVEELKNITGNNEISYVIADFAELDSTRKMCEILNSSISSLHLLVNNAGGVYYQRELTKEGFEKTLVNNHLSPFLLTYSLLDKIIDSAPARIVNVASGAHFSGRWNPNDIHLEKKYQVFWAYGNTKLYNILFTRYLAREIKSKNVTVNCLHPGIVRTKIGNKNTPGILGLGWNLLAFLRGISEEKGAETSIYLATSPEVEHITGEYFDKCKIAPSSNISNNFEAAELLWKMSMEMTTKHYK